MLTLRRDRLLVAAAFTGLLLACAFLIFRLAGERQELLTDFRRDAWLAVQAETDYLRLSEALSRYEAAASPATHAELMERLEAFREQIQLLRTDAGSEHLLTTTGVPELLAFLADRLPQTEHLLATLEPRDETRLATARSSLESYRLPLESLTAAILNNEELAGGRERLEQQYFWIFGAVVGVILSGGLLVVFMRREARIAQANYELARRAEAEASDLKERLVDAIESISEGFILLDDRGRVVMANSRYRELYPTISDLVEPGVAFSDLVWAAAVLGQFAGDARPEQVVQERLERLANPQGPYEQSLRDGRILLVSERRTGRGSLVSVRTDITELKQTQIALQSRLAAMEASIDGIAILDVSDRLVGVNKAFAAIFGHAGADSLIGRRWSSLFDDDENQRFETEIQPKLHANGRWRGERTARRADGTRFPLEASLTMLDDGGMVCIARDATEQHQAAAERQQLQEQFYQAQKMEALGRLSGGIAHDFNNILAAIIGYATFLTQDLPEGSEARNFARQVLAAGNRAKDLVQQILAFSRTQDTRRAPVDLVSVVKETLNMLWATTPATVTLKEKIATERAVIMADATQIGQVLMNLCVNARDALPEERGAITIELSCVDIDGGCAAGLDGTAAAPGKPVLRLRSDSAGRYNRMWVGVLAGAGRYAMVSVSDTGTGMSRTIMERMFEPFFTTKAVGKGTGLGLAAVHGIVAAHGGAITVESVEGEGTTFTILLPLAAEMASTQPAGGTAASTGGRELVLVVEDEPQVAAMMARALERLGYEVASCDDPADALAEFKENPDVWDIVVTDQTMPGLTGIELAREMLALRPDLPIVLCTGFSEAVNEEKARAAGIAAYLNKPVAPALLAATVRDVLDRATGRSRTKQELPAPA